MPKREDVRHDLGAALIPAGNEPSDCLQEPGGCREGHILDALHRCLFDASYACIEVAG